MRSASRENMIAFGRIAVACYMFCRSVARAEINYVLSFSNRFAGTGTMPLAPVRKMTCWKHPFPHIAGEPFTSIFQVSHAERQSHGCALAAVESKSVVKF